MASTSEQLIELAKQYASEKGLGYLGALTPKEAWELLNTNENAVLIDVRTDAELDWVGQVSFQKTGLFTSSGTIIPTEYAMPISLPKLRHELKNTNQCFSSAEAGPDRTTRPLWRPSMALSMQSMCWKDLKVTRMTFTSAQASMAGVFTGCLGNNTKPRKNRFYWPKRPNNFPAKKNAAKHPST